MTLTPEQKEQAAKALGLAFKEVMGHMTISVQKIQSELAKVRLAIQPIQKTEQLWECRGCGLAFKNPETLGNPFACPECNEELSPAIRWKKKP